MSRKLFALSACLLLPLAGRAAGSPRPLIAALSTCSALTSATYPADTVTWFDPARHSQIVFYAHWLLPFEPRRDETWQGTKRGPWHPPQVFPASDPFKDGSRKRQKIADAFYAEAQWIDPEGASLARYGLTLPARAEIDHLLLDGRHYLPHTFAMAVGIKDIRRGSGQLGLPDKAGQYHIRFMVAGQTLGLAFFRMLLPGPGKTPSPVTTPTALATPSPMAK